MKTLLNRFYFVSSTSRNTLTSKKGPLVLFALVLMAASAVSAVAQANQCAAVFGANYSAKYEAEFNSGMGRQWREVVGSQMQSELQQIRSDRNQAQQKLEVFEKFGMNYSNLTISIRDFIANYTRALDEAKIPEEKRIYPAAVLVKETEGKSPQFLFVTPGKDPWPNESGWRFYLPIQNQKDAFNIPEEQMITAHRAGRFPILAIHDMGHFTSFVMNPHYMAALREGFARLGAIPKGSSFYLRIGLLFETLQTGDPAAIDRMRTEFKTKEIHSTDRPLPLRHFVDSIEKLNLEDLVTHAKRLRSIYDQVTVTYGGGSIRANERNQVFPSLKYEYDGQEPTLMSIIQGQQTTLQRGNFGDLIPALHPHHLNGLLSSLSDIRRTPGIYESALEHQVTEHWRTDEIRTDYQVIEKMLREEVARTEHYLWNSSRISVETWVKTLLTERPVNLNSPVASVLREALGTNSRLWQRMTRDHNLETPH